MAAFGVVVDGDPPCHIEPASADALAWWAALGPADRAAAATLGTTCFGPVLAHQHVGARVVVEYEDGVDPTSARHLLDAFEAAWTDAVDAQGWRAPPGADRFLLGVYVYARSLGGAGTAMRRCGGMQLPVIAFGADALADPEIAASTAAHELTHAIQHAYGDAPAFWLWEASAVAMEARITASDAWAVFLPSLTTQPWLGFERDDRDDPALLLRSYALGGWLRHAEAVTLGDDGLRRMWEAAAALEAERFSVGQAVLFKAVGADLEAAHADFAHAIAVRDQRDGALYPPLTPVQVVDVLPADGPPAGAPRPEPWGIAPVRLDGEALGGTIQVEAAGEPGGDWLIDLVGVADGQRVGVWSLVDGAVEVDTAGWSRAWVLASPRAPEAADRAFHWSFSVDGVDAPAPPQERGGCGGGGASAAIGLVACVRRGPRRRASGQSG